MNDWFPTTPQAIYEAWLDGDRHAAMTGAGATSDARVDGAFSAWDGYISGSYAELEQSHRILMSWRTTDFAPQDQDSRFEVTLTAENQGTRVFFRHWDLPADSSEDYGQGWLDFYFTPMREYFSED